MNRALSLLIRRQASFVSTLPLQLIKFVENYDEHDPPSTTELNAAIGSLPIYSSRYLLNQLREKNSRPLTLQLVRYFAKHDNIDSMSVVPAIQALARAWIRAPLDEETREWCAKLSEHIPDNPVSILLQ